MAELLVDFITSLDGYGAAEGWPGWWGMESPEYLEWLQEAPERDHTILMGATTYRLMHGFSSGSIETGPGEDDAVADLTAASKVVFSSTLEAPLEWANSRLVSSDPVAEVQAMKTAGTSMRTLGSVTLCRSLLTAGVVDRFRVVLFPVVTGATGQDRIYDRWPDVGLQMVEARTFEGGLQLLEYVPTVLDRPPSVHATD
jgi:dihydrofolate reductase